MFCYYLAPCNSFTTPNDEAITFFFFFFEKCHDCIFFLQFLVKCLFEAVIADRCNKKGTICVKVTENNSWIHMYMLVTFLNVSLPGRSDLRFKAINFGLKEIQVYNTKTIFTSKMGISLLCLWCHLLHPFLIRFFYSSSLSPLPTFCCVCHLRLSCCPSLHYRLLRCLLKFLS